MKTSTNRDLHVGAKIIGAVDIIWGLLGIAGGLFCVLWGLRYIPEGFYLLEVVGGIFLVLSIINVITGAMLIVGVANGNRALLIVWLVKAFLYVVIIFPIGTIYYGFLVSYIIFLNIDFRSETQGVVLSGQPNGNQQLKSGSP